MATVLFLIAVFMFVLLVFVAGIVPNHASLSSFELTRRRKSGHDDDAEMQYARELLFDDVLSVQRVLVAILLVLFVLASVGAFGWLVGAFVAVVVALEYGAIARIPLVRNYSQKQYELIENSILKFLYDQRAVIKWLRAALPVNEERQLASRDELEHLVMNSHRIVSDAEKKVILSSLQFEQKAVRDVLTPKSVVETVGTHEMLGPLVLDSLHKTGHSRFPVINGDIDHVVGVLHLRDVLTVDSKSKHTARVESAMSKKVFYIREDHTLTQALSAFLRTHHHLFIVINTFGETTGIVTLEDTLEALLGRKIIDEFDAHDDMRAVASRQAATRSNQPDDATEV